MSETVLDAGRFLVEAIAQYAGNELACSARSSQFLQAVLFGVNRGIHRKLRKLGKRIIVGTFFQGRVYLLQ